MSDTRHVVMFSGGIGSWMAAKRVAERHGTRNLVLLFADTRMEDQDLYRFLIEAAKNVGGKLVILRDGRTPWDVFFDVKFLGNSRVDPCSRILKREPANKWLEENCDPKNTVVYVGIDWTEVHRYERLRDIRAKEGWKYEAPLCEPPYLTKEDMFKALRKEGIRPPRLYRLGFAHNNCGGFCVKAGQAQFKRLLEVAPTRYAYHERKEQELREYLGKNVTILRKTIDGVKRNITLREFREWVQSGKPVDEFDWGGCGCFVDVEDDEDE